LFFLLTSFLWVGGDAAVAAEAGVKSGPQAGDRLPGPFNPINVTNAEMPENAGKRSDYVEQHGQSPVVLVFAREINDPLTLLVEKLDAAVARNRSARLRAVVVVLSDDAALEGSLKKLSDKEGLKHVSLAFTEPAGLKPYKLSPSADVTVLLYKNLKVAANHAFLKGELDGKAVRAILADLPKVVPQTRKDPGER
jgi:hypothetical protein